MPPTARTFLFPKRKSLSSPFCISFLVIFLLTKKTFFRICAHNGIFSLSKSKKKAKKKSVYLFALMRERGRGQSDRSKEITLANKHDEARRYLNSMKRNE